MDELYEQRQTQSEKTPQKYTSPKTLFTIIAQDIWKTPKSSRGIGVGIFTL